MKYWTLTIIGLISLIPTSLLSQVVFKKMYGSFSPVSYDLKAIPNTNDFIISNHNHHVTHFFCKINQFGEPFDQDYIYQPFGGSTYGSHKYFIRNETEYDLIGLHATPGTYPVSAFIARRDSSLQNMIFSKIYSYRPSGLGIDSWRNMDSSYTIAGGYVTVSGQYYPMLFKLDPALNVSWSLSYQNYIGHVKNVIQAGDKGYYLLMDLEVEGMTLTRIDSLGNILWSKNYGNPFRIAEGMMLLQDGTILLSASKDTLTIPVNYTTFNPVLTNIDTMGNVIWSCSYGDFINPFIRTPTEPLFYVDTASNKQLIVCGTVLAGGNGEADILFMVLDSLGIIQWARRYGNPYFDQWGSICHQTYDNGFIVGGGNNYQINNFPPVSNLANVTIIKTDSMGISDGCFEYPIFIPTATDTPSVTNLTWNIYVDSLVTEVPSNMMDTTGVPTRNEDMCTFLSSNENDFPDPKLELFPNPTQGQFTITSRIDISLVTVYDITGRRVLEEAPTGLLRYSINLEGQPAGLYLVQITLDDKLVTRKIAVE